MNPLVNVLKALAEQVSASEKDYTAAAVVLGQLGATVATEDEPGLRELMTALAVVRERLESVRGPYEHRPLQALSEADSLVFLAGAMWASSEFTQARINVLRERAEVRSGTGDRAQMRQLILDLVGAGGLITPGDVTSAAAARELPARPDVVSKALSDLLREHAIEQVTVEGDRRRRHFRLAASDTSAQTPAADVVVS